MFYSHHLLARKAPLGQIWLAATKGEKINRRKLNKIDTIKICEEISNPQVSLALRVSGILMGGVLIVYESKVKLLYDDANRMLGEINQAWKVKDAPSNPTRLSKGKSHAKYETVTLPPNRNEDLSCSDTSRQVYYPAPLLEEWRRSIQPHPYSSPPLAPITPVAQSRPGVVPGSPEHVRSTAVRGMQKASAVSKEMTHEILPEEIRSNLKNNRFGAVGGSGSASKVNQRPITRSITRSQQSNLMAAPSNSGDELRSIPSSESESEHVSGRSSKKRPFVPSTNSGDGLEHKVDEGVSWEHPDQNFRSNTKRLTIPDI